MLVVRLWLWLYSRAAFIYNSYIYTKYRIYRDRRVLGETERENMYTILPKVLHSYIQITESRCSHHFHGHRCIKPST